MKPPLSFLSFSLCLGLAANSFAQSSRGGMGAVPYADANGTGVTFRTWAPNASSVNLRGAFNGWGSTAMARDPSGGTWSADVPRARPGDEYKFEINGSWRKDPRGKRVVNSAANSIVYDPNAFQWSQAALDFPRIWRNDLVVYQMHVGSYNAEDWLPSTFDECIEKIPYVKSLGFSAVKLLPVNEFPGDRSWGYNASDPYAIESSFGGPDGFKRFVQACHENGIAVLVDVVHNHYGPSDLEMWQYDGWSQNGLGGIYFYNDWKAHTDWGSTRPDYGRGEVRTFIKDQIRMYLEEYRVDGFRWDSVFNIRHASSTWNQDGSDMLWEVNNMVESEFGYAFRIAEDHAFDSDVKFEAQWDHDFLSDVRGLATTPSDSDRNMDALAYHLSNGSFNRVVYVESHDTCGDLNNKHRLPYDVDSGNPDGYWAKKRSLLAHGIALLSPGIPMVFAGSEMHEWYTFSNNQALRWSLTNQNAGIVRAFADLVHLRRNSAGVSAALKQVGKANVVHVDHSAKVVGVVRWDAGGQTDDLLVVVHASATPRLGHSVAFPSSGTWFCLYNSDSSAYDPSFGNVGPAVGDSLSAGESAPLDLGAYSIQIYSKSRLPQNSSAAFNPPNPSGCGSALSITFSPNDGPLHNAAAVFAHVGRNNWQWPSNHPMVRSGDSWTLSIEVPDDSYQLDFSFTDGADLWDSNNGANWSVPVSNCGDLPAVVSVSPSSPQGCIPVQFSYEANGGPLMGSDAVFLYVGRNGWQNVQDVPLSLESGDLWRGWFAVPDDTWQLDFVFHNSSNAWDNNNGRDWTLLVRDCVNSQNPFLSITNPAPSTAVSNSVSSVDLRGKAGGLAGHLRWTNLLSGASGSAAYSTNWSIPSVPLAEGVNVVRVSGTNSSANPNHGAWDAPSNSAYVLSSAWTDGMTAGAGLKPWTINGNGVSSARLAVDEPECSFGPFAWALQADDNGFVQAIRPFSSSLHPGDSVSFVFENGGVDGSPSSVGVAFENRFGQRLAEIYFEGGSTNYVLNDAQLRPTGIPWGNDPKSCSFEILSGLAYRLTFAGQSFDGEFAPASELLVSRIRFWNYNAGGGNERRFYLGPLSVAGSPLPVLSYSSEIAVSRPSSGARRTLSVVPSANGFVATLDSAAGIAGNVWFANSISAAGAWNWSILPSSEYSISNNSVHLSPASSNRLNLYSIGKPGGR